jgi:uroporphyrinogen III methyltransferase/synthase
MPSKATPLEGKRFLVTRALEQASELSEALRRRGAEVFEAPAIRIEPPSDWAPVDGAIQNLRSYDWIVFTSVNGAAQFLDRLHTVGGDLRELSQSKIAAIGPATRAALVKRGILVDVQPERFVAEEVFAALRRFGNLQGIHILLPRADIAREALPELLRGEGAEVTVVTAYRTSPATEEIGRGLDLVTEGRIDVVTFTSGSTVRSFFSAVKESEALRGKFSPASIGPITSQALRDVGFEPVVEASEYTTKGLVKAIVRYFDT